MALPELSEGLLSLCLRHVSMDRLARQGPRKHGSDLIRGPLGLSEADGLAVLAVNLDQVREDVEPRVPRHLNGKGVHGLGHLPRALVTHQVDSHGIVHVLPGQVVHPAWHGRGEEHVLPVRHEVLVDLLHVLLEPDVQHLVGLVQHSKGDVPQVKHPPLQHVDDPARGAHNDVHPLIELPLLLEDRGAAVDAHGLVEGRTFLDFSLHLKGKLPGGGQHESPGLAAPPGVSAAPVVPAGVPPAVLVVVLLGDLGLLRGRVHLQELLDDGNGEGQRLSRSRPRPRDEVSPRESVPEHRLLDWEEVREPPRGEALHDLPVQPQALERFFRGDFLGKLENLPLRPELRVEGVVLPPRDLYRRGVRGLLSVAGRLEEPGLRGLPPHCAHREG
mmetsp:Transcript_8105/g.27828  ORF Transcript_8105/g.27828 Transcript_8105/m.27828 type:complete len:387 (-) Transcript_8105:213-1373(-)